jgi:hypothetical protein
MIFELYVVKIITMKKIAFFLSVVFLFSACSSTKELSSTGAENRKLKRLAEQAEIKKAVESRRFIIKVDHLYTMGGRVLYMVPSNNFVIINGEIASISLGYMGRTYFKRPISGINLNGHTFNYKMESDEAKGTYKIQMVVKYGNDKFDVYLTIGGEGFCNISLNNAYIQTASYSGTLVPLADSKNISTEKRDRL